jgi:hypothetical protein
MVCDGSPGCGCCVPRAPVGDKATALRRALFTPCDAGGKCTPPFGCDPAPDGKTCTVHFDGATYVWASSFRRPSLEETRRQLCIKVDPPTQACFWALEIPGGTYSEDAPFPVHYTGSYECGGATCNDQPAFRVAPTGDATATLIVDGCSTKH